MTALLEVRGLRKSFRVGPPLRRQTVDAVAGVDLSLEAGRTLGLVGESGSGKSTTARLIMGLLPASSGSILFEGEDILGLTAAQLRRHRRKVQMVFQDPAATLNPRMSAEELVTEPLRVQGLLPRSMRQGRAVKLLDQVGLPVGALHRRPGEFSGGQRQRIAIARALALEPKLIVADEPVSALDVSVQAQILNLMKDLQAEHNVSYLFITHDLRVVQYMSDHLCVMQRGRIVERGSCEEIFAHPQDEYTQTLLAATPEPPELRADVEAEPDAPAEECAAS